MIFDCSFSYSLKLVRFLVIHSQATLFFSKKETIEHPLDIASRPTAPDPEKQSRNDIFEKSTFVFILYFDIRQITR